MDMQMEVTHLEDATLLTILEERVDAAIAVQFKDAVREAAGAGQSRVLLDMSRVTFLDSSGLGAVIGSKKQIGQGRTLELSGLTPAVAKVFRLTRMDSIFTIHETLPPLGGARGDQAHAC